jgi:hypothetical protein
MRSNSLRFRRATPAAARLPATSVLPHRCGRDAVPVPVKGVDHVFVEGRNQAAEIRGVPVALDEQDVFRIHDAYRVAEGHVEGPELGVRVAGREHGFVDQVVTRDDRLVRIPFGDGPPDFNRPPPVRRIEPQPRGAVRVADVAVVLAAGRAVHVENQVQAVLPAPADHPV